jgi:hypothetical protein
MNAVGGGRSSYNFFANIKANAHLTVQRTNFLNILVDQNELYVKFKVFEHNQALEIVARRCTLGVISLLGLSFCCEPREIVIHYFIALTSIDHINFKGYFKAVPFHILQ